MNALVQIEPTQTQIQAGMMALLQCAASDLESLSPMMFEGYSKEVKRVYMAMTAKTAKAAQVSS